MNFKEHKKNFNKRWNTSLSDSSEKEIFKKFKTRILNAFKEVNGQPDIHGSYYKGIDECITEESIINFCQENGIELKWKDRKVEEEFSFSRLKKYERYSTSIIDSFHNETNPINFYLLIERIFYLKFFNNSKKSFLLKELKKIIEISDINITISESENSIILYPSGEKK